MSDQPASPPASHIIGTALLGTEDKRPFEGFLARPPSGAGPGPGLVIFTEMWGIAPSKTEMAEDYAQWGWCALVPNMFWRSEFTGRVPFDQADRAWERLKAFDWDRAVDDARTAVQWLRQSPHCNGKVAAIGFCMGGRTAFLAAARAGADAAISLYALGIAQHLDEVRSVKTRVQLHYGLDDEHIPKSEIDAVAEAARANSNVEVHLYPGAQHGFFTRGRPAYNDEAVAAATTHIERLLATLK
jgi:carboxymethylenebutenolidase